MRLSSLYKFYQRYFNYTSNKSYRQKLLYAFAIRDTIAVLRDVYKYQNYDPLEDYFNRDKKSALTIKFLNNIELLAESRYSEPLGSFKLIDASIVISGVNLSTNKKEIIIPCPYICDQNNNREVIILTFGKSLNITSEIGVLKGLITEFSIDKPFPIGTRFITYWDLSSGTEESINFITTKAVSRTSLIQTLNKF